MKNISKIIVLFIVFSFVLLAQPFYTVSGKYILDPQGNKFFMKGTNVGHWMVPEGYMFKFKKTASPRLIYQLFGNMVGQAESNKFWNEFYYNYITLEDIKAIKQLGFNTIRVPFNYDLFFDERFPENKRTIGFKLLDRIVGWANEVKIPLILDMHCAPGGQTGDNIDDSHGYLFLYESPESRQQTIDLWVEIAKRYKDEEIIMGYDLLNEPIPHFYDTTKYNPMLEPFFKEMTKAIRAVDTNHILMYGGAQWNSNFKVFGAPFDSKAVYTWHKYWTPTGVEVIQDYLDFSNKYNVPIFCGETGENNDEWVEAFRKTMEENEVGWCYWPYKKLDNTAGVVSITMPEGWDKIIEYSEADRSNYGGLRDTRPDPTIIKNALKVYLQNMRLEKCTFNKGYLKALGLKTEL